MLVIIYYLPAKVLSDVKSQDLPKLMYCQISNCKWSTFWDNSSLGNGWPRSFGVGIFWVQCWTRPVHPQTFRPSGRGICSLQTHTHSTLFHYFVSPRPFSTICHTLPIIATLFPKPISEVSIYVTPTCLYLYLFSFSFFVGGGEEGKGEGGIRCLGTAF